MVMSDIDSNSSAFFQVLNYPTYNVCIVLKFNEEMEKGFTSSVIYEVDCHTKPAQQKKSFAVFIHH